MYFPTNKCSKGENKRCNFKKRSSPNIYLNSSACQIDLSLIGGIYYFTKDLSQ